ncbi:aminoglycoside 6-adenylyltransferase [Mycoplasmatota bacterium WC44]
MRDLNKMLRDLISFAEENENIRAMVLQGSFVNDSSRKDIFSDLDPRFYVNDVTEFTENDEWKNEFGSVISWFNDGWIEEDNLKSYTRLVLYEDGFKIDFSFTPIELAKYANNMQLYKVIVDKDGVIPKPEVDDERKFYVKKPAERDFIKIIDEFFWDTSYIVKSLYRDEVFFTKFMFNILQEKIEDLLMWHIGVKNNFKVNTGLTGRYFKKYLTDKEWEMLLRTYSASNKEDNIKALYASCELVRYLGVFIASELGYKYPHKHDKDMTEYINRSVENYLKE